MQPIDLLISQLQEGDMVQLGTGNGKRVLAFYEQEKVDDFNYCDQIWLGHQMDEQQRIFTMASPNGVDKENEDYCLEDLLPQLYLSSKNDHYSIGEVVLTYGRVLDPLKFMPLPGKVRGSEEDHFAEIVNKIYRITVPGIDNYVIANIVALGSGEEFLLSPISGWNEFPLHLRVSKDCDHEGTLYVPERSSFIDRPDAEEGRFLITDFRKIQVINIECYSE